MLTLKIYNRDRTDVIICKILKDSKEEFIRSIFKGEGLRIEDNKNTIILGSNVVNNSIFEFKSEKEEKNK